MSLSDDIVQAIIDDLSDRRGLKHEWNAIDFDVKEEIVRTWCTKVSALIEARAAASDIARAEEKRLPGMRRVEYEIYGEVHHADVLLDMSIESARLPDKHGNVFDDWEVRILGHYIDPSLSFGAVPIGARICFTRRRGAGG